MEAQTLLDLPAVLALEIAAGQTPPRLTLTRDEADQLAEHVATDLRGLVPQVDAARLALAGALFDPVELLRPKFPVWSTLGDLARRVPRGQLENVVAFGSNDGQMPAPALEPSPHYADGPMRLLPLSLLVPAELAETLSEQWELQLIGRGEAGAHTADWLMRTLGIPLEHVRYLTRHDLMALTCVQYEHVNLAPLWALLEAALLTPGREESAMSARGLGWRYAQGTITAQSPAQWLATQHGEPPQRAHDFAGIVFELRQYAALLDAHQLPLAMAGDDSEAGRGYLLETLAPAAANGSAPTLYAHEAPGLGVVAITLSQHDADGSVRVLAHGYPLHPQARDALLGRLSERYGMAIELQARGAVVLDESGRLSAPAR
ncbi:MAG TPA: hypothetical protein VLZ32_06090 [Rhodanobacter sp.]|nr:hypothetical protein [Rhodanobacter sp.]